MRSVTAIAFVVPYWRFRFCRFRRLRAPTTTSIMGQAKKFFNNGQ